MKLYLLRDPRMPSKHAMFGHTGTWSKGYLCNSCGQSTEKLIEPLLIEWFDGTETIGDFSWCIYTAVVRNRLKRFLTENRFEVRFGKVEVMKPHGKAKMPRIAFPYTGPKLYWMIPTKRVAINEAMSGLEKKPDCPVCGEKQTEFRMDGLYIPKNAWHGEKIFTIDQFERSGATYLPEASMKLLQDAGFTNFVAHPAGVIEE